MRPTRKRVGAVLGMAALALGAAGAAAQAPEWRVTPSVAATATYTDRLELPPGPARSGWILDVAPGLAILHAGPRLLVDLDYRLHNLYHPGQSRLDEREQRLRAFARMEAVEDFLFVDARGDIVQPARTATQFAPTGGTALAQAGRVETGVYQLSPHIRGVLGGLALYAVRYNVATIRPDDDALADTRVSEWTARLRNESASARLGWSLEGDALEVHTDARGTLRDSRLRAGLRYAIMPGLHVSATAGREQTQFAGPGRRSGSTHGAALEWVPGVRTQLAAIYEDRFFGAAHAFTFRHRTPRTAWRITSSREAAVLPALLSAGRGGSIEAALADLAPPTLRDPDARAREARRELEAGGMSATTVPTGGFLEAQPLLHETLRASVALLGKRNTVTFEAARHDQKPLPGAIPLATAAAATDVRQDGMTANWAVHLTPLMAVNLGATWLRTEGRAAAPFETRQHEAVLQLTRRLAPKATAAVGVRHARFESTIPGAGFSRAAVFITLTLRP